MSVRSILHAIYVWFNSPLQKPEKREEFSDPVFGRCVYCKVSQAWIAHNVITGPYSLTVMGRSRRPTPQEVELWDEVRLRMPALLDAAIHSLPKPSNGAAVINYWNAEVDSVRFENDGTIGLFLDAEATDSDGCEIYPFVTFRNWEIIDSGWTV